MIKQTCKKCKKIYPRNEVTFIGLCWPCYKAKEETARLKYKNWRSK